MPVPQPETSRVDGARPPGVAKALDNGLDPRPAVRVAGRRLELHHLRAGQRLMLLQQRAHLASFMSIR